MQDKTKVTFEREVNTYWELFNGARALLMMAENTVDGRHYLIMSSILLTAFSFEAYLNHLGSRIIDFWDDIEKIKVLQKYNVLSKSLDITPDFGKKPDQVLYDLFKFRNTLAHGKTTSLTGTADVEAETFRIGEYNIFDNQPQEHWEKYCTMENAKLANQEVEKIINQLSKAANDGEYPLVGSGITILSGHI